MTEVSDIAAAAEGSHQPLLKENSWIEQLPIPGPIPYLGREANAKWRTSVAIEKYHIVSPNRSTPHQVRRPQSTGQVSVNAKYFDNKLAESAKEILQRHAIFDAKVQIVDNNHPHDHGCVFIEQESWEDDTPAKYSAVIAVKEIREFTESILVKAGKEEELMVHVEMVAPEFYMYLHLGRDYGDERLLRSWHIILECVKAILESSPAMNSDKFEGFCATPRRLGVSRRPDNIFNLSVHITIWDFDDGGSGCFDDVIYDIPEAPDHTYFDRNEWPSIEKKIREYLDGVGFGLEVNMEHEPCSIGF